MIPFFLLIVFLILIGELTGAFSLILLAIFVLLIRSVFHTATTDLKKRPIPVSTPKPSKEL